MGQIWNTLIIQPISWLLLMLYNLTSSYGVAIILLAVISRVLLLFFSAKGKRAMIQQQRLEPKRKELELKYKNDKQKYQEALMQLYQKEGVSMYGGCLWSLLPFPVMIALYTVVREPLSNLMKLTVEQVDKLKDLFGMAGSTDAYIQMNMAQKIHENFAQVQQTLPDAPGLIDINFSFLGLNLSLQPTWALNWLVIIPFLSAATALLSSFLMQKLSRMPQQQGSMKFMLLLTPVMSLWFGFMMPSAMSVYWIVGNLLSIPQDYYLSRYYHKKFDAEDERRRALEARKKAAEDKMKEENRLRRLEEQAELKNKPKTYRISKGPSPKGKK